LQQVEQVGTAEAVEVAVVATALLFLENLLVVVPRLNLHSFYLLEHTQSRLVLVAVIRQRSIRFLA
jgi:hypothetical protein